MWRVITKFNCNLSHRAEAPSTPQKTEGCKLWWWGSRVDNCIVFIYIVPIDLNYLPMDFTQSVFKCSASLPWAPVRGMPLGCCPLRQPVQPVSVENLWDLLSGAPTVSLGYAT